MIRYTLRQLAFLSETARQGGIASAARQLHVSPAAISSALDKLETSTGLVLFDRFPAQGMRLTRVGEDFVRQADALLRHADALSRHAKDLAEGHSGAITIGTHYALAQQLVFPAVVEYRASHPSVRIEVVEDDFSTLVDGLDSGEVDALVVFDQGFDHTHHSVEVLMELPPLALIPATHDLASKPRLSLSDLTDLPYIEVSRAGPGPSYLDMLNAAGLHPEVPFSSQSRELVQAYVGKGFGFTLVGFAPRQERTVEGDAVVARPIIEDIGHFKLVLARSRYARSSPVLEGFLQLCREAS